MTFCPFCISDFSDKLLGLWSESVDANTVAQQENEIYIEALLDDFIYLSDEHKQQFVVICLQMTEQARPEVVRRLGYQTLGTLSQEPIAQKQVPTELISDLEFEKNHDILRNVFECLVMFKNYILNEDKSKLEEIFKPRSNELVFTDYYKIFFP